MVVSGGGFWWNLAGRLFNMRHLERYFLTAEGAATVDTGTTYTLVSMHTCEWAKEAHLIP